jgi:bacillopeptidase F (M6 metalloprotease family)
MSLEIFMRAKVTVRAKGSLVNSVFLVQLRKKVATDFRGSARIKQRLRDASFYR